VIIRVKTTDVVAYCNSLLSTLVYPTDYSHWNMLLSLKGKHGAATCCVALQWRIWVLVIWEVHIQLVYVFSLRWRDNSIFSYTCFLKMLFINKTLVYFSNAFIIFAVHGVEYAFGAHDYPTSGVFELEPRQCPGFKFRKSVFMGKHIWILSSLENSLRANQQTTMVTHIIWLLRTVIISQMISVTGWLGNDYSS